MCVCVCVCVGRQSNTIDWHDLVTIFTSIYATGAAHSAVVVLFVAANSVGHRKIE